MSTQTTDDHLAAIRAELETRAFLFDDPGTYLAGVDAAILAMAEESQRTQQPHLSSS